MNPSTLLRLITCLLILLMFSGQSCIVIHKKDNGNHNGRLKNPKNPHHHKSAPHDL
jgi:hypothetical protein